MDNTKTTWHLIEKPKVFSESLLWSLQQHYFTHKGIGAWQENEVPHYVTSNPTVANSYAEIVFALLHDHQRLTLAAQEQIEPLYLCELGAGSGRFAFHFLHRLMSLCKQAEVAPTSFCYVLTDITESNLAFWSHHPQFQGFFETGVLDVGLFDITHSEQLILQRSRKTITTGSLASPLVVIANYVWDSIPQDLFYLEQGSCSQCLVSLMVDDVPLLPTATELFAHLHCLYEYQVLSKSPYPEEYLQSLLDVYQRTLTQTHLLFPAAGLRCLQRLRTWSRNGLLVLSADKGEHSLVALQAAPAPDLVRHGSFSLYVNYHAFKTFCEHMGGIALFPDHSHVSLNVGCFLLLNSATAYTETQRAYRRHVQEFGPDDFYTISKQARQHIDEMATIEMLAFMRLSYYDSHLFAHYLPRLMELASSCSQDERQAIIEVIERVWASYFPLGEELDLAAQIASVLYEMDEYQGALTYFERSAALYGQDTGTLYNRAVCHQLLGQHEKAEQLLHTVVRYDPENQPARALLAHYQLAQMSLDDSTLTG
jgi:tetratricopeptide (TPR) repeat protein